MCSLSGRTPVGHRRRRQPVHPVYALVAVRDGRRLRALPAQMHLMDSYLH